MTCKHANSFRDVALSACGKPAGSPHVNSWRRCS